MSSSVKMATHETGFSWPYNVFIGCGVKMLFVFVLLGPIELCAV